MTNDFKGVARGVIPVNTGKVLIGRDYIPKHTHYTTEAELWTQNLLLSKPTSVTLASRRLVNLTRAIGAIFRRVK